MDNILADCCSQQFFLGQGDPGGPHGTGDSEGSGSPGGRGSQGGQGGIVRQAV